MKYHSILVPGASYELYETAARIVRKKLGTSGPSADDLILHELLDRDARMIADDYLEVRGQVANRPALTIARSRSPGSRPWRRDGRKSTPPSDPSLN